MGKGRPIWRGALVTASVAIGVFLAACSHDPVTPAPVYMGSAAVIDTRSAATPWPQPAAIPARQPAAGATETRRATAAPAPLAGRTAQTEHASRRPIMAANHSTRAQKKVRARLATKHVAPRKQATIYPVPERAAAPSAGGETIRWTAPRRRRHGRRLFPPAARLLPSERIPRGYRHRRGRSPRARSLSGWFGEGLRSQRPIVRVCGPRRRCLTE